jgi:hypothetical protein
MAVEVLYADQLKPISRLLRKRVFDHINRFQAPSADRVGVDMGALLATCQACPLLSVEVEGRGEWSALLVGRISNFVDIHSTHDVYPAAMWADLQAFLEGPCGSGLALPGGRCAAAEALQAHSLEYFKNFSLGQICHIVELAVTQKRLLGYRNGVIVPYQRSECLMKEQQALQKQPCPAHESSVATLEVARACLLQLLQESPSGAIPLPNVKRLFASHFNVQLSETMFGHTRVSELLQDERFQDLCTVEFEGKGFIVRRRLQVISLTDRLHADANVLTSTSVARPAESGVAVPAESVPKATMPKAPSTPVPRWSLSPNTLSKDGYTGIIQNTFIHAKLPPRTPLPGARRRTSSVPKDMGLDQVCRLDIIPGINNDNLDGEDHDDDGALLRRTSSRSNTGGFLSSAVVNSEMFDSATTPLMPSRFSAGEALRLEDEDIDTFQLPLLVYAASTPMTPLMGDCQRSEAPLWPVMPSPTEDSGSNRLTFCPDEPLSLEYVEDNSSSASSRVSMIPTPQRRKTRQVSFSAKECERIVIHEVPECIPSAAHGGRSLTPGTLLRDFDVVVRGTFLNVPPSLPTPFRSSAKKRSHSEPRSIGSLSPFADSPVVGEISVETNEAFTDPTDTQSTGPTVSSPFLFPPTPWT